MKKTRASKRFVSELPNHSLTQKELENLDSIENMLQKSSPYFHVSLCGYVIGALHSRIPDQFKSIMLEIENNIKKLEGKNQ